jgi:hypothetical protein
VRPDLVPADDAALEAVARLFARAPIDPPGFADHVWLHAETQVVVHRLQAARDHRVRDGGRAWVIHVASRPVGYLSARIQGGTDAETFSAVVRSEQGKGIGLAARRSAIDVLATAGLIRVTSLARPASASAAISRRLGYELRGTETRVHPAGYSVELERYELGL